MTATPRAIDDAVALVSMIQDPKGALKVLGDIQKAQEDLDKRAAELDEREKAVANKLGAVTAAHEEAGQREMLLDRREADLIAAAQKRDAELNAKGEKLDRMRSDVAVQNEAAQRSVAHQDMALRDRADELRRAKAALMAREEEHVKTVSECRAKTVRLAAELKAREDALGDRERTVAAKEERLKRQ